MAMGDFGEEEIRAFNRRVLEQGAAQQPGGLPRLGITPRVAPFTIPESKVAAEVLGAGIPLARESRVPAEAAREVTRRIPAPDLGRLTPRGDLHAPTIPERTSAPARFPDVRTPLRVGARTVQEGGRTARDIAGTIDENLGLAHLDLGTASGGPARGLTSPPAIAPPGQPWGPRGGPPTPSLPTALREEVSKWSLGGPEPVSAILQEAARMGDRRATAPALTRDVAPRPAAERARGQEKAPARRAAPPDLPLPRTPAVVAPPVYEHVPDPWSRGNDPVGPGFHREPVLRNNVWEPPPGGYSTEDNPRWHEGTPAWQAQRQQFINRGQIGGTPTTRREAMAALPGSPLEKALQEYYKEPADFPGRSVPTPAGPGTATIGTLRGNEPGQVAFYSPQQKAEMRSRGIDVSGPLPPEWNRGNLLALQSLMEKGAKAVLERRRVGAEETKAAADMKTAETGAKTLEVVREQGRPERMAKKMENDLQADPTLRFNDEWRQSMDLPKLTAQQKIQQAASKEEAPAYTYEQIQKADLTPQILLNDPTTRPQAMEKIKALEKGFDPDAFWTKRFPPSEAKTPREKAEYAFSQIAEPDRRASYRNLYNEYLKTTKAGQPSNP